LVASCTKDDITPPDDTPKKQVDIPWPSLAKSPWPMNHGNPQSTGRSSSTGPTLHQMIASPDPEYNSQTGIAIGEDSTIYQATYSTLCALHPDGTVKWETPALGTGCYTTPLITNRGNIIVGWWNGYVSSVRANGSLEWQYQASGQITHTGITIGMDGTIYLLEGITPQSYLTAISSSGNRLWQLRDSTFHNQLRGTLTCSPDGKTLYVMGYTSCLTAVDLNTHSVKWKFGKTNKGDYESQQIPPAIDNDGNIYLIASPIDQNDGKPSLFCLRPDGSIKWSYIHNNALLSKYGADPVIDYNGNISFAYDTLYSIKNDGTLLWKLGLADRCEIPLVCNSSNTIFVTTSDYGGTKEVMAIADNGILLWRLSYATRRLPGSSAALAFDMLVVSSWTSTTIFIIR
jgi:outer membrane protein assembly factor BamB